MLNKILIVSTLCIFAGCAATPSDDQAGADEVASTGSDCIFQRSVRDYRVLNDSNLIVTAAARRIYHIELSRPAFGLQSSWQLGFSSPTGRICEGFSEVVIEEFGRAEKIRIRSIREVNADERDKLLIQYGKKEAEIPETPEPVDVEGADVEELD